MASVKGGLGILLKSFGINIDPEQVERDYEQLKLDIALWGKAILDLKLQFDRVEAQNAEILLILKGENHVSIGNGKDGSGARVHS